METITPNSGKKYLWIKKKKLEYDILLKILLSLLLFIQMDWEKFNNLFIYSYVSIQLYLYFIIVVSSIIIYITSTYVSQEDAYLKTSKKKKISLKYQQIYQHINFPLHRR